MCPAVRPFDQDGPHSRTINHLIVDQPSKYPIESNLRCMAFDPQPSLYIFIVCRFWCWVSDCGKIFAIYGHFCVQNTIKRWNVDQTKDHCVYRSLSAIQRGFAPGFVNYKKGILDSQVISLPVACLRSVVLSGYSASSTTKTGRHDIAEILLKMMLNTKIQIHSFQNL